MSAGQRGTLLHLSLVSGTRYLSEALFVVRGFALARLLGPEVFGVWSSMRLVRQLGNFSALGATTGMVRLAPVADGDRDPDTALRYRRGAAGVALLGALAFAAVAAAVAWGAHAWRGGSHLEAWLGFAAVLVLSQLHAYHQALLQSKQRFLLLSAAVFCFAVSSTALGVLGAWRFGLGGFLTALGLSYGLVLAGAATAAGWFPRPLFECATARSLMGVGHRILIAQILNMLHGNVDKLLIWWLAGSATLGIYAVPTYLSGAVLMFPVALAAIAYPRLLERLGSTGDPKASRPYLERVNVQLAQLAAPVIGLLYLALHLPFAWWLPDYAPAIAPGRVLMLASFFPIVATLPSSVLIALGGERPLIAIRVAAVAISGSAVAAAMVSGAGLREVALATSAGFAIKCVVTLLVTGSRADIAGLRAARWLGSIAAPYAALLILLAAVGPAGPASDWRADLTETARRAALVCGPLALWALAALARQRRDGGESRWPGM